MSVIVGRALPDVRDGLKPVHRRVLFAMNELNNDYNRPYVKSRANRRRRDRQVPPARRHGAVYDTIVRMAQPFSHALPAWSTARATSARSTATRRRRCVTPKCGMSRIAGELLADIDKETVPYVAELRRIREQSPRCCRRACRTCW